MIEYLHRHVRCEISLSLAEDVTLIYQLDVEGAEKPTAVAHRVLDFSNRVYKQLLAMVKMPADPLQGDEPLIFLKLEYHEVVDEGDGEINNFAVTQTETVQPGKGGEAVDNATSRAFKSFTKRITQYEVRS